MIDGTYIYQGHEISIHAFLRYGRWGWRFQIGANPPVTFTKSTAYTEDEARREAMAAVHSILDLRLGVCIDTSHAQGSTDRLSALQ